MSRFLSLRALPLLAVLLLCGCVISPAAAEEEGKVWRIAYIEGGPFVDYQKILRGLALGLQNQGLIENGAVPIPEDTENAALMWQWLVRNAGGHRIEFLKDGFYSADWDASARASTRDALLERIRNRGDVDMLLAFGTWGGQDFAAADITIPVIVASVTNAVEAGIIPSAEDSGKDNLVAPIEPDRFKRQVILFHDIFQFKKLGIAYEDNDAGRSSIALNELESAAAELDIDLISCTDTFDIDDGKLSARRLKACHEKLAAQGAEAVYLTYNRAMMPDTIADILQPLAAAHIPTFSQLGVSDVQYGALLSIAQTNTEEEGMFNAELMKAIIQGAKPRSLSQKFESSVSLALNLRMATLIGWNPPLEILAAVDEFYQQMD